MVCGLKGWMALFGRRSEIGSAYPHIICSCESKLRCNENDRKKSREDHDALAVFHFMLSRRLYSSHILPAR